MPAPTTTDADGVEARAVLLGERIDVRGLAAPGVFSQIPFAFHDGAGGMTVVHRFGAVVFVGVDRAAQDATIAALRERVTDIAEPMEVEVATLLIGTAGDSGGQDNVVGSGRITLADNADERLLIVADALAKSVALADDERYLRGVFEKLEPFALDLAATGGASLTSKALLRLLGETLVAQARMVGRVEVQEKPDLLWDRPDLQRLHAKLKDEYELIERANALARKVKVVEEIASTLADVTDVRRTVRLEIAVVALIAFEIVLSLFGIFRSFH